MKKNALSKLMPGMMLWLGVSAAALAAPSASRPVRIPVSADSQVHVALSNTNPNMLVVPGDRITAVDAASGMFLNEDKAAGQKNGSVLLMTAQTKPFTFYIRTEGGLSISVVGVPQHRQGRVLQFISDIPVQHDAAKRWETDSPYPQMLVQIQKAVLQGRMPEGFSEAPVAALPDFSLPSWLAVRAEQMWNGGALRVYRLSVRNRGVSTLTLQERLFRAPGVRSVMVFPYSTTLLPGAQTGVWVTVSNNAES